MEQLLLAFGIDGKLIIIQIINFVVLASLLTYFLYKPVLKILAEREEGIKQGIKDTEDAARAKASAQDEKHALLARAQTEAQAIDARATAFAKVKEADIVAQANAKASDMVRDAQAKSELLKTQTLKESEAEIAKLAVLAAQKVLQEKAL